MILGYEQPVAIPGMLVYDKDMMKMYLGALLKDYEEGLAAEKEFNEKYAGFLSPSAKDTENYYNLSLGPIQLYLNQNPNAIRSVEGRGRLRLLMNSIPYDKLALLRASAKTQEAYRNATAQMIANGQTPLSLEDIGNWDTLAQGLFTTMSPTVKKSLDELLAPSIKTLLGQYRKNEAKSKLNGGIYDVYDVDPQRVKDQMATTLVDIKGTPYYDYYQKQSGLTPDQFDQYLIQHVEKSLGDKSEVNPYKKAKFENDLTTGSQLKVLAVKHAYDVANAAQAHKDKMAEIAARYGKGGAGKNGKGSNSEGYSVSYYMYSQGLANVGTSDDSITKAAIALTDKKFKKYAKNGKMPQSVRNSRAYQNALTKNKRFVISQLLNNKINNYIALGHTYGTSSKALATGAGLDAILSSPDIMRMEKKDANHNGIGTYKIPGSKIVDIYDISYRRGAAIVKGKIIHRKSKKHGDAEDVQFLGSGDNFIQQYESDGMIHQYYALDNGKWYDAGIYKENQQRSNQDMNYLNRIKLSTKAVATALPVESYDVTTPLAQQLEEQYQ